MNEERFDLDQYLAEASEKFSGFDADEYYGMLPDDLDFDGDDEMYEDFYGDEYSGAAGQAAVRFPSLRGTCRTICRMPS